MRELTRPASRPACLLPLAAAIALVFAQDATSLTGGVVVLNCRDSGPASLRDAYSNAIDNEIIDLTNLTCGTITLTTGALVDSKGATNVTLLGPGVAALMIDANSQDRALVHKGSGALTIKDLTITRGSYNGAHGGGCIYSHGSVHMYNSTVSACTLKPSGNAPGNGGGVYALGSLDLATSTVSGNTINCPGNSAGSGGGIWSGGPATIDYSTIGNNRVSCNGIPRRGGGIFSGSDAKIYSSTISANVAGDGGGAYFAADAIVKASTISGNNSSGGGASGLLATHQLFLGDCTITKNDSGFQAGAAVHLNSITTAKMYGTIIYGNPAYQDIFTDDLDGRSGAVVIGSNNLIGVSLLAVPSGTLSSDPLLGPLSDNGGAAHTFTHALLKGSPAIDRGINTPQTIDLTKDQRGPGFARVAGTAADIGAFEFLGDRIFSNGFD